MKKNNIIDIAIIGNGPAGMAAAIQLSKYNVESLYLFGEDKPSGLYQMLGK